MAKFPTGLFPSYEERPDFLQSDARPLMEEWQQACMQLPGGLPPALVSIENDTLTPTQSAHIVDTEGEAGADELKTIAVAKIHDGCILELYAADDGRTITVKHSPSEVNGITLVGGADKQLQRHFALRLQRSGDYWKEASTSVISGVGRGLEIDGKGNAAAKLATMESPGIVQPDGKTISVDTFGVASVVDIYIGPIL